MAQDKRGRRQDHADRGRYTPRLWSVWLVASIWVAVASALAVVVYLLLRAVAVPHAVSNGRPAAIDPLDVIKTTITVAGFFGAVLVGVYGYRKQRLLSMARLADDWGEQRQVCIDVLCAYLRMPYEPDPASKKYREGEREVRHTIIRIIHDHLQDPADLTTWCYCDLDFTNATFDGGNFDGAKFAGGKISFFGAEFTGGDVSFEKAKLTGDIASFDDTVYAHGYSIT